MRIDAKKTSLTLFLTSHLRSILDSTKSDLREIFLRMRSGNNQHVSSILLHGELAIVVHLYYIITRTYLHSCVYFHNFVLFRVVTRRMFSTRNRKRSLKVVKKCNSNKIIKIINALTCSSLNSIANNCQLFSDVFF